MEEKQLRAANKSGEGSDGKLKAGKASGKGGDGKGNGGKTSGKGGDGKGKGGKTYGSLVLTIRSRSVARPPKRAPVLHRVGVAALFTKAISQVGNIPGA